MGVDIAEQTRQVGSIGSCTVSARIAEQINKDGCAPLVSICCTTYNHARYICDCLDGFLMQETTFPVEILIHDDASTDGTADIIREYAARYPRLIKPILQTENQYSKGVKPNSTFNFPRARGEYIALCEGDDYWIDRDKLQKQVDFLQKNPDYVVCYHNSIVVDENNRILSESRLSEFEKRDYTRDELVKAFKLLPQTMCFRNVVHSYPAEYERAFGGDKFLTSLLGAYGAGKYLEIVGSSAFRKHAGGVNSSAEGTRAQLIKHLSTRIALYQYYERLGNKVYSEYFLKEGIAPLVGRLVAGGGTGSEAVEVQVAALGESHGNSMAGTAHDAGLIGRNLAGEEAAVDAGRHYVGGLARNYEATRRDSPKWHFEEEVLKEVLLRYGAGLRSILDAPVGTGRFLPLYRTLDANVQIFGCDYSQDMLRLAAEHAVGGRVQLLEADLVSGKLDVRADLAVCYRFLNLLDWAAATKAIGNICAAANRFALLVVRVVDDSYTGPLLIENKIHLHREQEFLDLVKAQSFAVKECHQFTDERAGSYRIYLCERRGPAVSCRLNYNGRVVYTFGNAPCTGKVYEVKDEKHALFIRDMTMSAGLSRFFPCVRGVKGSFVVVEWVAGKSIANRDMPAAAALLATVHGTDVDGDSSFDYVEDLVIPRFYRAAPLLGGEVCDEIVAKIHAGARRFPKRLSHPDVNPGNLVMTGKGLVSVDNELLCSTQHYLVDVMNMLHNCHVAYKDEVFSAYVSNDRIGVSKEVLQSEREYLSALWVARQVGSSIVKFGSTEKAVSIYNDYLAGLNILPLEF